jgi:hypothetical protein
MLIHKKDIKRFWKKVDIRTKDKCWEWQAYLFKGYGQFHLNGYTELAHRLAFKSLYKMKDENNLILHKCNNRKCVNPNHLYEGNYTDNMKDYYNSNNINYYKGKLNEECVKVIKWMLKHKPKHGLSAKLAKLYNVSQVTISMIKSNKRWQHIKI